MKAGKHVLTEKLMAHNVAQCKEMGRVAEQTGQDPGRRPSAALQHSVRQRGRHDPARPDRRHPLHSRPVASRQPARQRQLAAAAARRQNAGRELDKLIKQNSTRPRVRARSSALSDASWRSSRPNTRTATLNAEDYGYENKTLPNGSQRTAAGRTDPLADLESHRRRLDGRAGQPSARRGRHLHQRAATKTTRRPCR